MKSSNEDAFVTAGELYKSWGDELGLAAAAGHKGFDRKITSFDILKPGLILHTDQRGKVKVLGRAELNQLNSLKNEELREYSSYLTSKQAPCFIVSKASPLKEALPHYSIKLKLHCSPRRALPASL